jgi:hypothetical protein
MSASIDFSYLTIRQITAYNEDGSFVRPGLVLSISTNGRQNWTNSPSFNNVSLSTLTASTITTSTITTSTMQYSTLVGSTITADKIGVSSIIGSTAFFANFATSTLSVSTLQANNVYYSTAVGSSIQTVAIGTSSLNVSSLQATAETVSSLTASTLFAQNSVISSFQVSSLQGLNAIITAVNYSTLTGSSIHTTFIGASSLGVSSMQVSVESVSSLSVSSLSVLSETVSSLTASTLFAQNLDTSTFQVSSLQSNSIQSLAIGYSTLTGSSIVSANGNISTFSACTITTTTIVASSFAASTITVPSLTISTFGSSSIIGNVAIFNTGYLSTINVSSLNAGNNSVFSTLVANTINVSTLTGSTVNVNSLTYTTATGNTNNISTANISTLNAGNTAVFSTLVANTANISTLTVSTLLGSAAVFSTATTNNSNVSTLTVSTLLGSAAVFSTATTNNSNVSTLTVSTLLGSAAVFSTATTNNSNVSTLTVSTLLGSAAVFSTATTNNSNVSTLTVSTLLGSAAVFSTATTNNSNVSTLTVSTLLGSAAVFSSITTNSDNVSTLTVSTLLGSAAVFSTITVNTNNISTLTVSTLLGSTATFSTVTVNTNNVSTMTVSTLSVTAGRYNTLNGSEIVTSTLFASTMTVSTLTCSTFIGPGGTGPTGPVGPAGSGGGGGGGGGSGLPTAMTSYKPTVTQAISAGTATLVQWGSNDTTQSYGATGLTYNAGVFTNGGAYTQPVTVNYTIALDVTSGGSSYISLNGAATPFGVVYNVSNMFTNSFTVMMAPGATLAVYYMDNSAVNIQLANTRISLTLAGQQGATGPSGVTGQVATLSVTPTTTQVINSTSALTVVSWGTIDASQSIGNTGLTYSAITSLFTNTTSATLPLLIEYTLNTNTTTGGYSAICLNGVTSTVYGGAYNDSNWVSNSFTVLLSAGSTVGVYYTDGAAITMLTTSRLNISLLMAGGLGATGYTGQTGPVGQVAVLSVTAPGTQTLPVNSSLAAVTWNSVADTAQSTGITGLTYNSGTGLFTNNSGVTLPLLLEYSIYLSVTAGGYSAVGVNGTTNTYGGAYNDTNWFTNSYTVLVPAGQTVGLYYMDISAVLIQATSRLTITVLMAGGQGSTGPTGGSLFGFTGTTLAAGATGTSLSYSGGFIGVSSGPTGTSTYLQQTAGATGGSVSTQPQYTLDIEGTERATTRLYADNSVAITAQPSLDYSTFSSSWSQLAVQNAAWSCIAASATGQNLVAGITSGSIWYSQNYGQSWLQSNAPSSAWSAIALSGSGQYGVASIVSGTIYYTANFGQTWISTGVSTQAWTSVAISTSGQYAVACINAGGIWLSQNFGATFVQSIAASLAYSAITVSASGQYVTAVVNAGTIYYSNNYGLNWLTSNAVTAEWSNVDMSATGQYQTATITSGSIYYSSNYGQTWTASTAPTNTWRALTMSSSGQYQVAATYTANLLYNYQFNLTDIQGAKLLNFATGQYDAALVNGALISSVNPKVGTGLLSLTGSASQYLSLPSFTMTAGYTSSGLTFAFWFKTTASLGTIFQLSQTNASNGYLPSTGTGSMLQFQIVGINLYLYLSTATATTFTSIGNYYYSPAVNTGNWIHAVFTMTSSGYTLYINGAVATFNQNYAPPNYFPLYSYNSGVYPYVYIGNNYAGQYFTGSIDDFRMYTTALNASQVAALYNSNNGIVGTVQYSTNFGATWSPTSSIGTNTIQANYQALTMASTGQQVTGCLNIGTMFQSVTAQPNMATSGNMTVQGNTTTALTTYMDGTANVTAGLNLDYTTFGQSWAVVPGLSNGAWVGMCISATGQYQSITNLGNYIWYSSNYGQSWTSVTSTGTANFYAICMSASGQYQSATVNSPGSIYISSNYGVTWTIVPNTTSAVWHAINMSASGQYQSAAAHTGATLLGIWYSTNYGQTWTQSQTSGLTTRNWYFIGISASGQYQNACEPGGTIWYSTNYGQSWIQVNQVFAGARGICMSASGQYQSACTYNTGTSGTIYYSNNYGQTWTQSASILVYGLQTICMSASGQYQSVVGFGTSGGLYYSTNYGVTWTLSNAAVSAGFYSVCMSANAQYILYGLNGSAVYQSVTASPAITTTGTLSIKGVTSGLSSTAPSLGTIVLYGSQDSYAYPEVTTYAAGHGNSGIFFDMYYNGVSGSWASSTAATPSFGIYNVGSTLRFVYSTAAAAGSNISQTIGMIMNSSGQVGIGTASPASRLHLHAPTGATEVRINLTDGTTGATANSGVALIKNASENFYLWNYAAGSMTFGTNNIEAMTINTSGNVGIGTANADYKLDVNGQLRVLQNNIFMCSSRSNTTNTTLEIYTDQITVYDQHTGTFNYGTNMLISAGNASNRGWGATYVAGNLTLQAGNYISDGANNGTAGALSYGGNVFINAGYALEPNGPNTNPNPGVIVFQTSSRAYNNSALSERMRITNSGNVGIGTHGPEYRLHVYSNVNSSVYGSVNMFGLWGITNNGAAQLVNVVCTQTSLSGSWNQATSIMYITRDTSTNRSVNAAGTINASGADYAEYMYKAGSFIINKGDIVGIDTTGKLTNQYDNAISFMIKSTNPSYVGGDSWGTDSIIGSRPEKPTDSTESVQEEYQQVLATWEAALEVERQKVDRIAFSGQVPVNVQGAVTGNYIIPVRNQDGTISGQAIAASSMTLGQYQEAVGKVINILPDGRANVIVKSC